MLPPGIVICAVELEERFLTVDPIAHYNGKTQRVEDN